MTFLPPESPVPLNGMGDVSLPGGVPQGGIEWVFPETRTNERGDLASAGAVPEGGTEWVERRPLPGEPVARDYIREAATAGELHVSRELTLEEFKAAMAAPLSNAEKREIALRRPPSSYDGSWYSTGSNESGTLSGQAPTQRSSSEYGIGPGSGQSDRLRDEVRPSSSAERRSRGTARWGRTVLVGVALAGAVFVANEVLADDEQPQHGSSPSATEVQPTPNQQHHSHLRKYLPRAGYVS